MMKRILPIHFENGIAWNYSTHLLISLLNSCNFKYDWMLDSLLDPILIDNYTLTTETLSNPQKLYESLFPYFEISYYSYDQVKKFPNIIDFIVKQIDKKRYVLFMCNNKIIYKESKNNRNIQALIYGYDISSFTFFSTCNIDMIEIQDAFSKMSRPTSISQVYCPFGVNGIIVTLKPRKKIIKVNIPFEKQQFDKCFLCETKSIYSITSDVVSYVYYGLYSILYKFEKDVDICVDDYNVLQNINLTKCMQLYFSILKSILENFNFSSNNENVFLSLEEAIKKIKICQNLLMKFSINHDEKLFDKIKEYINQVINIILNVQKIICSNTTK